MTTAHGRCAVSWCDRPATTRPGGGFGSLCLHHKQHRRVHGDPLQEPISARHLKPYLKGIKQARRLNPDNPVWGVMRSRWADCIDEAREYVAQSDGSFYRETQMKACKELLAVAEQADRDDVINTVTALTWMLSDSPGTFKTHDGLLAQVARRYRHLAPMSKATRYDHQSGRVRLVYRELGHRVNIAMGQMLIDHIGSLGPHLASVEKRRQERKQEARQAFAEGVRALV
jgi:hypothetical protein